jgi:hypothetical protein
VDGHVGVHDISPRRVAHRLELLDGVEEWRRRETVLTDAQSGLGFERGSQQEDVADIGAGESADEDAAVWFVLKQAFVNECL